MHKTISGADIVFPDHEPTPPFAPPAVAGRIDMDAVLHEIWRTLDASGTSNGNQQLVAAIEALIAAGVNTQARIVHAAMNLGYDRGHAGAVLGTSEGADPERHRWQRGSNGRYRRHAAAGRPRRPWPDLQRFAPSYCDHDILAMVTYQFGTTSRMQVLARAQTQSAG